MEEDPEEFTEEQVTEILREALRIKLEEKRNISPKFDINKAIVSTLGEYLDCFKLMGYDLNGNPLKLIVYKNNVQKSALSHLFMEDIGEFMNGRKI